MSRTFKTVNYEQALVMYLRHWRLMEAAKLLVKHPMAEAKGFDATQVALRDVGLFQADVRCNLNGRE